MTIDLYRMLQSLEREAPPSAKGTTTSTSSANPSSGANAANTVVKHHSPHKYLLYKYNIAQLNFYLSTSFKELEKDHALLLYLSLDGENAAADSVDPYKSICDVE